MPFSVIQYSAPVSGCWKTHKFVLNIFPDVMKPSINVCKLHSLLHERQIPWHNDILSTQRSDDTHLRQSMWDEADEWYSPCESFWKPISLAKSSPWNAALASTNGLKKHQHTNSGLHQHYSVNHICLISYPHNTHTDIADFIFLQLYQSMWCIHVYVIQVWYQDNCNSLIFSASAQVYKRIFWCHWWQTDKIRLSVNPCNRQQPM